MAAVATGTVRCQCCCCRRAVSSAPPQMPSMSAPGSRLVSVALRPS